MRCQAVVVLVTALAGGAAAGVADFAAGNNLAFYQNLTDSEVRMRERGERESERACRLFVALSNVAACDPGHTTPFWLRGPGHCVDIAISFPSRRDM
jgi:hypothetical protein